MIPFGTKESISAAAAAEPNWVNIEKFALEANTNDLTEFVAYYHAKYPNDPKISGDTVQGFLEDFKRKALEAKAKIAAGEILKDELVKFDGIFKVK